MKSESSKVVKVVRIQAVVPKVDSGWLRKPPTPTDSGRLRMTPDYSDSERLKQTAILLHQNNYSEAFTDGRDTSGIDNTGIHI